MISYTEEFNEFWINYPREGQLLGSKKKAFTAFSNIPSDYYPLILNSVLKQKSWRVRATQQNMFVPVMKHPVTWLNQECWEDELPEIQESVKPQTFLESALDRSWAGEAVVITNQNVITKE